ncbi:excitatory amino acid transporter 1 [Centruroides vittatus]|uniref:excitatory amino acid transporter 1 n=1 Tax=Centruroides vittatus TaxID=120091 RepID=UPI0035104EE9
MTNKLNGKFPITEKDTAMGDNTPRNQKWKTFLRQNLLTLLMFLSVVVGIGLGIGLREFRVWNERNVMYISFPGELFLRMLKCLILPLIVSSLISAIGSLDTKLSGRIGARAVVYYLATTVLAIILGIVLVVIIRPGKGGTVNGAGIKEVETRPTTTADTLMDLVRNMFPPNLMEACISQTSTSLTRPENASVNDTDYYSWAIDQKGTPGTNILGIVVFSIVLGITLGQMKERGKPVLMFFSSLGDAMMMITKWVIWLSPVGVLFLVTGKIVEMDDLSVVAGQLGLYTATVLVGLFIHGLITLPLIYFVIVRKRPFTFMYRMLQAITTAFGTSSSSATLPVTIACLEDKNQVDPKVSRFCLPIGATINMDGTALYEAVAAIFIAQIRNVSLDAGKIVAISITATAASIGAAGIPQAGLVTMVMVLNAVGLPADDVAFIYVVDWFLDRFRTAINVLGDSFGAGIVAHLSRNDLTEGPETSVPSTSPNTAAAPQVTSM